MVILSISAIIINNIWVNISTRNSIYSDIENLTHNRVGLIPGCNKYIKTGVINYYYVERIKAGARLFKAGKIDYILVSGDNAHASYDEPREMKMSLIEAGVPKDRIVSDYAGFRTLDTIIRAKEVFQLERVTFISQDFQNKRGVFIGQKRNIEVIAFNAGSGDFKSGVKIEFREVFAKVKMVLDLYILDKKPKFLGDKIIIGEDPVTITESSIDD